MRTLLMLTLLAACGGSAPRTEPATRGPRADQHVATAREHSDRARELSSWPDRRSVLEPDGQLAAARWSRTFDTPPGETKTARAHLAAAAALQAAYDEACRDLAFADISLSPIQRYGQGGSPTSNGVRVFLSKNAGTPDAIMAELRCHRAWMMMGRTMMDDCPLDLPGLHIEASGDENGITLDISIDRPALVPELQRRTTLDLEGARTHADRGHE